MKVWYCFSMVRNADFQKKMRCWKQRSGLITTNTQKQKHFVNYGSFDQVKFYFLNSCLLQKHLIISMHFCRSLKCMGLIHFYKILKISKIAPVWKHPLRKFAIVIKNKTWQYRRKPRSNLDADPICEIYLLR